MYVYVCECGVDWIGLDGWVDGWIDYASVCVCARDEDRERREGAVEDDMRCDAKTMEMGVMIGLVGGSAQLEIIFI